MSTIHKITFRIIAVFAITTSVSYLFMNVLSLADNWYTLENSDNLIIQPYSLWNWNQRWHSTMEVERISGANCWLFGRTVKCCC